jgi:pentapeptide MXKDX repeat protein
MKNVNSAVLALCLVLAAGNAFAQDNGMAKDANDTTQADKAHDGMKKDAMGHDAMKQDAMSKNMMTKDAMSKDANSSDMMKKDTMSQDTMNKDSSQH